MSNEALEKLKKEQAKAKREKHEREFDLHLRTSGFPVFEREYRFAAIAAGWDPDDPITSARRGGKLRPRLDAKGATGIGLRDWKFDFAWPEHRIAVEVEGAPGRGRHTTSKGFTEDCVKYAEAMVLGWSVFRFTGAQVHSAYALNVMIRAFRVRGIALYEIPF